MESWAKMLPQARFVCVCVESKYVALNFHRTVPFEHCMNAYIPSGQYMPRGYGQLGCSGFIVSDKDGYFVSRKTAAYLQYGEGAFRHLESILLNLLPEIMDDDDDDDEKDNDDGGAPTAEKMEGRDKDTNNNKVKRDAPCEEEKKHDEDDKKRKKYSHEELTTKIQPPPSVGVDSMDDEHKECTDAFNATIENPTAYNLHVLHDILKEHFDHEEELISEYSTSSSKNDTFSALTSHKLDHQRILKIAKDELDRIRTAPTCSTTESGKKQ